MPLKLTEQALLPLFRKFINEIKKGKHLQKNGKRIKPNSIRNYKFLEQLLTRYSEVNKINIVLKFTNNLTKKQFADLKKYWKDFYISFTGYLHDDLNHYDNYVGRMIKLLRSFFNYLINEKGFEIGFFHRKFYTPSEDIDIVILSTERLNYLIDAIDLEKELSPDLIKLKDVFVFGCIVALRHSDLMTLTKSNLEVINNRMYIRVQSKKTQTYTRVKLPEFASEILNKYSKLYTHKLLPQFDKSFFNKKIKLIMEHYGFTEQIIRTRHKRGIPYLIYKNSKNKTPFRFCDSITSHTMRRSAITNMLSLGMNEHLVRQISGHAANSKEFFRYVAFAQTFVDTEIDMVYKKMSLKKMELLVKK